MKEVLKYNVSNVWVAVTKIMDAKAAPGAKDAPETQVVQKVQRLRSKQKKILKVSDYVYSKNKNPRVYFNHAIRQVYSQGVQFTHLGKSK